MAAPNPQNKMLSFAITDINLLHQIYMPFLRSGGLFIATDRPYKMGDELFLLLTLPDQPNERSPITGQVVWITPAGVVGNKKQGVGIQFIGVQSGDLKKRIEHILAKNPKKGIMRSMTL